MQALSLLGAEVPFSVHRHSSKKPASFDRTATHVQTYRQDFLIEKTLNGSFSNSSSNEKTLSDHSGDRYVINRARLDHDLV
jgi:hypothetical protein